MLTYIKNIGFEEKLFLPHSVTLNTMATLMKNFLYQCRAVELFFLLIGSLIAACFIDETIHQMLYP